MFVNDKPKAMIAGTKQKALIEGLDPTLTYKLVKYNSNTSPCTVKPVLSGHLKIDKTKELMENGSLMKDKSIAECSPWSIMQYF